MCNSVCILCQTLDAGCSCGSRPDCWCWHRGPDPQRKTVQPKYSKYSSHLFSSMKMTSLMTNFGWCNLGLVVLVAWLPVSRHMCSSTVLHVLDNACGLISTREHARDDSSSLFFVAYFVFCPSVKTSCTYFAALFVAHFFAWRCEHVLSLSGTRVAKRDHELFFCSMFSESTRGAARRGRFDGVREREAELEEGPINRAETERVFYVSRKDRIKKDRCTHSFVL